ncbi:sugar-binding protein [Chryseobacterium sp. MYb7]|uniref:DUF6443 domain-containing protein n=1 Tax=Chryseobacterium sp. MYb7 TaxID=1827290 RepID=UPI000D003999|nr:DUF6443 domain-containing protein [Chryseobacterium sp. MYb7]PRA95090.1 sugar-binding protein [Chryseobacterium sp. MYb7]
MKKILIPISALLVTGLAHAQLSTTENYLYSKTYLDYSGTTPTKSLETAQYFDGLGRPKQIVNVKASPLGKDVVTHIEYDQFGRQVKDFLPIPQSSTQNGAIFPTPLGNASTVYGGEKIYSEKVLENSPLDRILEQKQVGNDWNGKSIKFGYQANTIEDKVRKFATATSWINDATFSTISNNGTYGEGQLYKNIVTNEDDNKTIEFKNGKGQVLLVRKIISATENADTYYVYNEYDQLTFVIPPLLSKLDSWGMPEHDALAYQYRYDGKGRLVEKKLPGKGWEFMVYDKADRMILSQDANQRASFSWMISKYDIFGRPIYTGIKKANNTRIGMQNQISGGAVIEGRANMPLTANGMDYYYTNMHWGLDTLLSVTYYDSYPQQYGFNPPVPSTIMGEPVLSETPTADGRSTKGLPVLSLVKNIEDDGWTKTYTYYDRKGRVIGTHSINHLGGYTHTESKLDFAGVTKQTVTRHKRLDIDTERVITETFDYDNQNRLLVHKHQVDSNPVEILVQNTYNELSQITNKKVGGTDTANPLQSIDYQYNIRGWLTKINDPATLNGKLFGYQIKYTNPVYSDISSGRYNGNIAEIDWNMSTVNNLKRYNYTYDKLNRLTDAEYAEPEKTNPHNKNFDEHLTYDVNGNITFLKRNAIPVYGATATQVDNLEYKYTGNRLNQVIESSLNDSGYEGGNNMIDYDSNGNMINMKDKGIQSIIYNYLNLPKSFFITQSDLFGNGQTSNSSLDYLYRADGVKLRKTYSSAPPRGLTRTTMNDYLDGFQYSYREGDGICLECRTETAFEEQAYKSLNTFPGIGGTPTWKLDFVPTSEGFYSFIENRYIYQYKDHLGNARVSFAKNSEGALEVTDTNNYYPFGLNHIEGMLSSSNFGSYYSYKYNGKELQETGMYDYGARMYMPDIGRWGVVDPLAEQYRRFSPYNYTVNNPIRFTDPDGRGTEDWVKRTGQSGWEYRSDITSAQQASDAGYAGYANGRGDINSTYTTPMSSNGIDTGVNKTVVLGEGGNYKVDGESFIAQDNAPYVSSQAVDNLGKALSAPLYFPMLLEASPLLVSGGSAEVLAGKATLSTATQFLGTGDVNIMSVVGDTFGAYGSGEVLGGVSELSAKKLINGESAFRTVFNGGGMSPQEAASNIGFALGSKGLGKLNGATKVGATGVDKAVVGVNNFLIGTGMYGAAAVNATEIQKKQK